MGSIKNLNINTMEKHEIENKAQNTEQAKEFNALGYTTEIVKSKDSWRYNIILIIADTRFIVSKDYNEVYQFRLEEYTNTPHVSSRARGEVYRKNTTNNVKVLTVKKITDKINACIAERDEMNRLEAQAVEKERMFLADLKATGEKVEYEYAYSSDWNKERREVVKTRGKLTGGRIEKNGIEYRFNFDTDGYIKQTLEIRTYPSENTPLQNFVQLSDNNFKA
jgi:hypothetical protein